MFSTKHHKHKTIIFLVVSLLALVYVLSKGAIYYLDSYAFLDMRFNRSVLYSSFLKLYTTIFGSYFEWPVVFSQLLLILFGVYYTTNSLDRIFEFKRISFTIILVMMLSPVFYWHLTANKLLSEALAYPLFLTVFSGSFNYAIYKRIKDVYRVAIALLLLLLCRGQFIVLVPLLLFGLILVNRKQFNKKHLLVGLVLLILTPFINGLITKSYNKVVHGYFVSNAMTYVHLVSADFYISQSSNTDLFENEDAQNYFKLVHNSLNDAGLTREKVVLNELDDQEFYEDNFSKICNERVHEIGLDYFKNKGFNYYDQNIYLNDLCKGMFPVLLKANYKNRIKLFLKNFKTTYGGSKYLILFAILFLIAIWKLRNSSEPFYTFVSLGLGFMLVNNLLIAFVMYPNNRYTFYFDWLIFAVVLILLENRNKKILGD
ncbi:MAG: hypothetical protein ACWA5P_00185 [bacterium]